jgi:hypothetical protein
VASTNSAVSDNSEHIVHDWFQFVRWPSQPISVNHDFKKWVDGCITPAWETIAIVMHFSGRMGQEFSFVRRVFVWGGASTFFFLCRLSTVDLQCVCVYAFGPENSSQLGKLPSTQNLIWGLATTETILKMEQNSYLNGRIMFFGSIACLWSNPKWF